MSTPSIRTLLLPLAWLLAAAAAVKGVHQGWFWTEILAGWGLVCLNAGAAWVATRVARDPDPSKQAMKVLAGQFVRALLLGAVIFLVFRLDFLESLAFLTASFVGYLSWMAGHVLTLHRNSLNGS